MKTTKAANSLRAALLLMFVLQFSPHSVGAAPMERYHSRYPYLSAILSWNGSVWFPGSWATRLLAVERDGKGNWHTFVCPGASYEPQLVVEEGSSILYLCWTHSMSFDRNRRSWQAIADTTVQRIKNSRPAAEPRPDDRSILEVKEGDSLRQYHFPLPSFNAYRRWRFNSLGGAVLEASVGEIVHVRDCLWFGIDFYAGEGNTGIGGLGMLDLKNRQFGVLRDECLSATSANRLQVEGDTICIATGLNTEEGLDEASGLVLVDLKHGGVANADTTNSPLVGGTFKTFKLLDGWLWMLTDEAIVGWDMKKDRWTAVRVDSVVTNSPTILSRRVYVLENPGIEGITSQDTLVGVSGQTMGVRSHLDWVEGAKVELDVDSVVTGWVAIDPWRAHQKSAPDAIAGVTGLRVFADSGLSIPYHYIKFGMIAMGVTYESSVRIQTRGRWVNAACVDPVYSVFFEKKPSTWKWAHHGENYGSLKHLLFSEFQREQQEVKDRVPVYDTTFVIRRGMDLFEAYDDLVGATWLPGGRATDAAPTGAVLRVDPFEQGTTVSVSCDHGGILVDGKHYEPGTNWLIKLPKIQATFRFSDVVFADKEGTKLESMKVSYALVRLP